MKLSVVIPLFNEEPHLEQTLEVIRRELAILEGDYELEIATVRVPAQVGLNPLYDPKMERIKA